ncbi:MAG: PDZ domain-containing protein, partial [Mariniphaga sp.]|nr:PDZ domain-containing protein [Mariniphaga sp.]
ESGQTLQLEIHVKGDLNFARERWENVSANNLGNPNISPTGKRALFEYRGEIFTVPKEKGTWRNLTNSPGVADRFPVWSPKGDQIAWFYDKNGEYELVIANQFGEIQKTFPIENPTFFFKPEWAPDGKKIVFTDTHYNIWIINIENGALTKADSDLFAHPNRTMNPVWSPDSKWILYARQLPNSYKAAFAFNAETAEKIQLTDGMADVISPVWDEKGKYIYFLASTDYGLNTGWLDMSSYDPDVTRSLYCLILSKEEPSPVLPKSDEEEAENEKEDPEKKEDSDKKEKKNSEKKEEPEEISVKIDKDGLELRTIALNLPNRNYPGLIAGPENSVFIAEIIPNNGGLTLHKFDVKENKAESFLTGIQSAETSADRKNILYKKGSSWFIIGTASAPKEGDGKLETSLKIKIDPKQEYHQIFKEAWRYMRDFLYVDNVHGAPWDKIYEWYSPWIEHVRHRTDLNYVVDILSGEVSIGHSYVSGGDMPDIDQVPVGLLGCDFTVENGYYKMAKIYTGENWNPDLKAPMAMPGIEVNEGDYLLAVNGKELKAPTNPYSMFEQTAGRNTMLLVNSSPSLEGARTVIVEPVSYDGQLRNMHWVESNRKKVDELSGGKMAYVYLPNTGRGGFNYFNRYYFAQQHKKGVILDERNNGGGSAADYMIDVMSRTLLGYFNSKTEDNRPWTTPMAGIWGPKVMIINERAGSGGDLLPYMFREKNLGPLVGTRTWGGLVGTWDTPPFIDGGRMVAPRGGFIDANGNWAVEGEGIAPDIEVIQEPKLVLEGRDPQLEKAVEVALDLLKENEIQLKPEPPA